MNSTVSSSNDSRNDLKPTNQNTHFYVYFAECKIEFSTRDAKGYGLLKHFYISVTFLPKFTLWNAEFVNYHIFAENFTRWVVNLFCDKN